MKKIYDSNDFQVNQNFILISLALIFHKIDLRLPSSREYYVIDKAI